MPFTFSHPALIIPLLHARRQYPWLSATGLITGSVAPDFEKFFRLKLASSYSHTIVSIFYFSCPVALGLAFVFHLVVRRPLLAHLPAVLYRRLGRYASFNWLEYFRQSWVGVLLSIVVGSALHLFWDGFTHDNTLIDSLWPALATQVWVGHRALPMYQVVGLISSGAGALAIGWSVWKMPIQVAGPLPVAAAVYRYWGTAGLVAVALVIERELVAQPRTLSVIITAISAALVGVVVASVDAKRRSLIHRQPL